jgi:hypothetical protein
MKTNIKLHSIALASVSLMLFLVLVFSTATAATEQSASPVITKTQITKSGTAWGAEIYGNKLVSSQASRVERF